MQYVWPHSVPSVGVNPPGFEPWALSRPLHGLGAEPATEVPLDKAWLLGSIAGAGVSGAVVGAVAAQDGSGALDGAWAAVAIWGAATKFRPGVATSARIVGATVVIAGTIDILRSRR